VTRSHTPLCEALRQSSVHSSLTHTHAHTHLCVWSSTALTHTSVHSSHTHTHTHTHTHLCVWSSTALQTQRCVCVCVCVFGVRGRKRALSGNSTTSAPRLALSPKNQRIPLVFLLISSYPDIIVPFIRVCVCVCVCVCLCAYAE